MEWKYIKMKKFVYNCLEIKGLRMREKKIIADFLYGLTYKCWVQESNHLSLTLKTPDSHYAEIYSCAIKSNIFKDGGIRQPNMLCVIDDMRKWSTEQPNISFFSNQSWNRNTKIALQLRHISPHELKPHRCCTNSRQISIHAFGNRKILHRHTDNRIMTQFTIGFFSSWYYTVLNKKKICLVHF